MNVNICSKKGKQLINIFTNDHNGELEYYSNEKGRELLNKSLPCNNKILEVFPAKPREAPQLGEYMF